MLLDSCWPWRGRLWLWPWRRRPAEKALEVLLGASEAVSDSESDTPEEVEEEVVVEEDSASESGEGDREP